MREPVSHKLDFTSYCSMQLVHLFTKWYYGANSYISCAQDRFYYAPCSVIMNA